MNENNNFESEINYIIISTIIINIDTYLFLSILLLLLLILTLIFSLVNKVSSGTIMEIRA